MTSLAGMLFNFMFVCAHVDIKMLRVREAGCIVACCVGERVQASCRGPGNSPSLVVRSYAILWVPPAAPTFTHRRAPYQM